MMDTYPASNMDCEVMKGLAGNERDGTLGKVYLEDFEKGGVEVESEYDLLRIGGNLGRLGMGHSIQACWRSHNKTVRR